jgi:nitrogen fixation NifU-like protein
MAPKTPAEAGKKYWQAAIDEVAVQKLSSEVEEQRQIAEELRKTGYSEATIDHWLNPKNLGRGDRKECDGFSDWFTGPCGDSMEICLKVRNGVIQHATFISDLCIGAVASGSTLTEMVRGKTIIGALGISAQDILDRLGGLPDQYVHCADLARDALRLAIRDYLAFAREPWRRAYQRA